MKDNRTFLLGFGEGHGKDSGCGFGEGQGQGCSYGFGSGYGSGFDSGSGFGEGSGEGSGKGSGKGFSSDYDGTGESCGYSDGHGYGSGSGAGYGSGAGHGKGHAEVRKYSSGFAMTADPVFKETAKRKSEMENKEMQRAVLVANKNYGLYIGYTSDTHEEIVATESVRVTGCRHVCQWYGKTGGITSLAAHGPCGPRAMESRVGAAVPGVSTLSGVVNVFALSPEAVTAFDAIQPT